MVNEAIRTLEHYFRNESNTVQYLGSSKDVELFADVLQYGKTIPNDAPDAVIIKDDIAIIIEHFEFDSFQVNRKGSTSRIEQARIEREQKKIQATEKGVIYHSKIKANCSYQDYIDNVTTNFLEHYKKIDTYKKNLLAKNITNPKMTIKIMFLIEDVSPIGSIVVDNSNNEVQTVPVILAQSPEFLSLVSQSKELDYVLCCSFVGETEYIWFVSRNEISAYQEKQCNYANMRFLNNNPSVVIGKMLLPDTDLIERENNEFL